MNTIGVPARQRGRGFRLRKALNDTRMRFVLVALVPLFAWYGIFVVWALVRGVSLAFTSYHLIDPSRNKFVGLRNFEAVLNDPLFPVALRNSALWGSWDSSSDCLFAWASHCAWPT